MKKKIWIPIAAAVLLLAILLIPLRTDYDDGGTREWRALTYRVVEWNRLLDHGTYRNTRIYFGADCFNNIDQLWQLELKNNQHTFTALITDTVSNLVLVQPVSGENGECAIGQITFRASELEGFAKEGDVVEVTYLGDPMGAYPAWVHLILWQLPENLRELTYPGQWLDPKQTEALGSLYVTEATIQKIYADCFFASFQFSDPYTIKVNGTLSADWCIGDQVRITGDNACYDVHDRWEMDLLSIEEYNYIPNSSTGEKPVIYLYPQQETQVSVKLHFDGQLTCTYPDYRDGWQVTACPDGTLTDEAGQIYNYLYWEGITNTQWDMTRGFCIKGEDTAAFLEEALAQLGLNRKEANEFIVYWLPIMQENPYNIISFQTDVYTDAAKLEISPSPDTLIRVFMAFQASETPVTLEPQELTAPERQGFTVVEWGGTAI